MRFLLLLVSSLLLVLFVAGGLGSVAQTYADNPYGVCADFNGDGQVGIADIGLVVQRFGTNDQPLIGPPLDGEPEVEWDPRFDLDNNGFVGMFDIGYTAAQFGETCSVGAEKIPFETITQNIGGGIAPYPPEMRVARTQDDWEALWEEHVGGNLPLPLVNFEEEMVVGVFLGTLSSGYALTIDGFVAGDAEWAAEATFLTPGFCIVIPVKMVRNHIVRVQRTQLPVRLELREYTYPCSF